MLRYNDYSKREPLAFFFLQLTTEIAILRPEQISRGFTGDDSVLPVTSTELYFKLDLNINKLNQQITGI